MTLAGLCMVVQLVRYLLNLEDNMVHCEQVELVTVLVTCRWHARLDVSWVGSVANSTEVTVLRSDPKPLLS
jgi:hypothetical protein